MKLKTIREFKDIKENRIREVGEVFEVDDKRAQEILNAYPPNPLVETVEEPKDETEEKPKTTRRKTRKAAEK
jgi:hypothetical protein